MLDLYRTALKMHSSLNELTKYLQFQPLIKLLTIMHCNCIIQLYKINFFLLINTFSVPPNCSIYVIGLFIYLPLHVHVPFFAQVKLLTKQEIRTKFFRIYFSPKYLYFILTVILKVKINVLHTLKIIEKNCKTKKKRHHIPKKLGT